MDIAKIDVQQLSKAGYRASKVIGSSVLNDANETIGKVDDLLISPDGKTPYTVLSIGGFLGMDSHYVNSSLTVKFATPRQQGRAAGWHKRHVENVAGIQTRCEVTHVVGRGAAFGGKAG